MTRAALFAGAAFLLPACGGQQGTTTQQDHNDKIAVPIDGGVPIRAVETVESNGSSETPEELAERLRLEQEALDRQAQEQAQERERQQELQRRQNEQRRRRPACIQRKDGTMVCPPYGAPASIDDLAV